MKAEFAEGIAHLERWYNHRDKWMGEINYATEGINIGWMANKIMPDEVQSFRPNQHGTLSPTGQTYIIYQEVYRHDTYQLEEWQQGNTTCMHPRTGTCYCYGWPGAILTMPWTKEDEEKWLTGAFYMNTENPLIDGATQQHLTQLYGKDPSEFECIPNDVVLVIEMEEQPNATEEVQAGTDAPDAVRQWHASTTTCPHGAARIHEDGSTRLASDPCSSPEQCGSRLRDGFKVD